MRGARGQPATALAVFSSPVAAWRGVAHESMATHLEHGGGAPAVDAGSRRPLYDHSIRAKVLPAAQVLLRPHVVPRVRRGGERARRLGCRGRRRGRSRVGTRQTIRRMIGDTPARAEGRRDKDQKARGHAAGLCGKGRESDGGRGARAHHTSKHASLLDRDGRASVGLVAPTRLQFSGAPRATASSTFAARSMSTMRLPAPSTRAEAARRGGACAAASARGSRRTLQCRV